MRLILSQLPVSLADEEMDEILRAGDANGDGVFDLAELGCGKTVFFYKTMFCDYRVMLGYREFDRK